MNINQGGGGELCLKQFDFTPHFFYNSVKTRVQIIHEIYTLYLLCMKAEEYGDHWHESYWAALLTGCKDQSSQQDSLLNSQLTQGTPSPRDPLTLSGFPYMIVEKIPS